MVAERHLDRGAAPSLARVDHVARRTTASRRRSRRPGRATPATRQSISPSAPAPTATSSKRDAVALGERRAQPPGAAVRVAVQLARRRAASASSAAGNGPNGPSFDASLTTALEPELALHLLDRLAGLVRDEPLDGRPEEAVGDLGDGRGHARTVAALTLRVRARDRPLPARARAAADASASRSTSSRSATRSWSASACADGPEFGLILEDDDGLRAGRHAHRACIEVAAQLRRRADERPRRGPRALPGASS